MLKTSQQESTGFEENDCPNCGLKREEWSANAGQGFQAKGVTYCCQGCAEKTGCLCSSHLVSEATQHPGVQVLDHGHLHPERRRHRFQRSGLTERRTAPGRPTLS